MNRYLASITNESGSALLVIVVLVPVLTLFCFLAANVSFQNQEVTTSEKCHHNGLYNADGALYGSAALISQIGKNPVRQPVQDGEGNAAPGIKYKTNANDFAYMLSSTTSANTTEDLDFIRTDKPNNFGVQSTVDMEKYGSRNPAGGGAEFGNSAEGIGTQVNIVVFRLRSAGKTECGSGTVNVNGDYWMIVSQGLQTKGI